MESSFPMSWNNDTARRNKHESYFRSPRNSMIATKTSDDNLHSTTQAAKHSLEVWNEYTTKANTDDKAESHQCRVLDTPCKKRAKIAHFDPAANATRLSLPRPKGKQRKSLSLLVEMPLDVLYEIFGHLHPRDMINLTRTSRTFRETLLSRSAVSVWRTVCDKEGTPERPNWISEPAWAALLFEHVCQSCGARNVQKIDFLLMKRVCLKCKKLHLISLSGIFGRHPEAYRLNISSLLPATNISSWSHKYTRKRDFYWDTDVEDVITRLSALKQDIDRGLPDSQKLSDDFKEEQKRRVKYIKDNFGLWNDWHMNKQSARRIAWYGIPTLVAPNFGSQAILPTIVNTFPAPPPILPSLQQSGLSQEAIKFERDFETWLHSTEELSLTDAFERDFGAWFDNPKSEETVSVAIEGSPLFDWELERDFGQWFQTEPDLDFYGNVGSLEANSASIL